METITNSLEMTFQASEGDNVKVTLCDQKADLTSETVLEAMNNMVALEVLVNETSATSSFAITADEEARNLLDSSKSVVSKFSFDATLTVFMSCDGTVRKSESSSSAYQ